jgi:hypothetical protein
MFSYPLMYSPFFQEEALDEMHSTFNWKLIFTSICLRLKSIFLVQSGRIGVQFYVGFEDDSTD